MANLCDFIQIIDDTPVNVPNLPPGGAQFPLPNFSTSLRLTTSALLIFAVRKLDSTAKILVNGTPVGSITPTVDTEEWTTQMVSVSGNTINNGVNTIVIESVADLSGFDIKNLHCFFHQAS